MVCKKHCFVYAKKVANFIGSNHKEVLFTKQEGLNVIKDVVYTTDRDTRLSEHLSIVFGISTYWK